MNKTEDLIQKVEEIKLPCPDSHRYDADAGFCSGLKMI